MSRNCGIVFSTKLLASLIPALASKASITMSTSLLSVSLESPQFTPFTLFRQPEAPAQKWQSQNKITPKVSVSLEKPHMLRNGQTDRVAILNQATGSYCAYSLAESVRETGLTQQEAEEWIEGRLTILKQSIDPGRFLQAALLIGATSSCMMIWLWGLLKLIF